MQKKSSLPFLPKDSAEINCCRNPLCSNFMVPVEFPDFIPVKRQKNPNKLYKRISNKYGYQLQCQECNETLPIKNKLALDDEIQRLKITPEIKIKAPGCRNKACENYGIPVTEGRQYYSKFGTNKAGTPRFKCKACCKTFSINTRPHLHHTKSHENKWIFKLLVNKSPFSRIVETVEVSPRTLYEKIDFIYKQCVLFSRHKELLIPKAVASKRLNLSSDAQYHMVNWSARRDKKNTRLQVIATACNDSSYVFGAHLNYDPNIDQGTLEGWVNKFDQGVSEPAYRQTAKYWTISDYVASVQHSLNRKTPEPAIDTDTQDGIRSAYDDTLERLNIDDSFELNGDAALPHGGVQIHSEYTMLAHFSLIAEKVKDAKKVIHNMDLDSGIRTAFMLAYREKLKDPKQRWVDGFYVKFAKEKTVDEKLMLFNEKKNLIRDFCEKNGVEEREAVYLMLEHNIETANEYGRWKDRWVKHVQPSMAEPERMICHLNNRGQHQPEVTPWVYMKSSLSGVDRFFMQSRRMVQCLERPIKSSAVQGNMWNGYNAYNPKIVMKLVEIFRVYYNFCKAGDDGQTPAQRLGLSKGRNSVEDILYYHPHANLMRHV